MPPTINHDAPGEQPAVVDARGTHTYAELRAASARAATRLLAGENDLEETRVAFLMPPAFDWVATQWSIWRAGGIAVPLCLAHPRPELERTISDCDASILVADPELTERLEPLAGGRRLLTTTELLEAAPEATAADLPEVPAGRRAMIVYTSGTTARPKGVVTTHANLAAQMDSLIEAWEWSADDRILSVLPLHHVHGIVNVVGCALRSGAVCDMLASFDAAEVWRRIEAGGLTLFMAVPTIYSRLIAAWEAAPPERRAALSAGCRELRLMVSGSAALPIKVLERWREISGHTLLERYGMTEIGMALSNPLHGRRRPGHVGSPLPGVEVRRRADSGEAAAPDEPGELEIRGPGVFREYWRRPEETAAAFREGWFATGDVAVLESGSYRLLGRSSVDIIKSGGYKISALEIEEALRAHPAVAEIAVVGIPDEEWGERVAAGVVLAAGCELDLESLRDWARERLAAYKLPSRLLLLDELPRNPLGKVVKPQLAALFEGGG